MCATAHVLVGAHTRMYTLATECGERRRRRRSRGHVYRTCIHAWGSLLHVHVTHTPHTEFRPRQPRAHVSARRTAERIEGTRFFSFSPLSLSLPPSSSSFSSSSRAFRSFQPRKRLSRGWGEGRGRLGSIGSIRNGEDQREGEFRRELSLRRVLIAEEKRRDGR